jgi:uncharacterized protein YutE (UPF0331/DUF86 family)
VTPRPSGSDREALETKLRARLDRLPGERRTLVRALAAISPDNDLQALVDAFNSSNDDTINRVRAVERNFEVLHNFLVEIVRLGLELDGSRRHDAAANAPRDIDELRRRGVLSATQAKTLLRMHEVRSGLQHWYPDMVGPEAHQAVTDLLATLTPITQSLKRWIEA